jgi:periplasmic divalent cation tolerance protein
MLEAVQVVTTTGQRAEADAIAEVLVQRRLAACVQVSGPVSSCYRWKGEIQRAEEWVCTIKTTVQAYEHVEQAIRELHPYEEPEILALPISHGSQGYLRWLTDQIDWGSD